MTTKIASPSIIQSIGETSFDEGVGMLAEASIQCLSDLRGAQVNFIPNPQKVLHVMREKEVIEKGQPQVDPAFSSAANKEIRLDFLWHKTIGDCARCKLSKGRTNIVFGDGNPNASIVFVGEAPGAEEDSQGLPFVGRSGKLLTKMINAMGFERSDIFICNVVKCRPPDNRDPENDEVESCEPFLKKQLAIIGPKVIVALGRYACQCLLRSKEPISKIRGRWAQYEGIPLMPTFHPAYLLRNGSKKREVWEDLQQVMKKLG